MATAKSDYTIHIRAKDNYSKVMLGATAALAAISVATVVAIKAANEQELAEKKLATALGHTSQSLLDQASALQKVSTFGDETIIKAQALIAAFVKDEEQIKAATKATLDLAAAKGFDLVTAADLVSKTLGSSTNALTRYGIEVKGAVGSTERLTSLTENISKVFGGQAKAETETFGGATKQLSNAFGDVLENIGFFITKNPAIIKAVQGITTVFSELASAMGVSAERDVFDIHTDRLNQLQGQLENLQEMQKNGMNVDRQLLSTQRQINEENETFITTIKGKALANREEAASIKAKADAASSAASMAADAAELTKSLTGGRPTIEGDEGDEGVSEVEKLRLENELKIQEIILFNERELELMNQLGLDKDLIEVEAANRRLAISEQVVKSELQIQKAQKKQEADLNKFKLGAAQSTAGNMLGILNAFGKGSSKAGKVLFLIEKGLAISRAIVATELAAVQALALPPAPNIVAATAARTMGYSGVALIAAQSFTGGGGGKGGGGGSIGGGISSGPGLETTPVRLEDDLQKQVTTTRDIKIIIQTATGDIPKETLEKIRKGLVEDARDSNKTLDSVVVQGA